MSYANWGDSGIDWTSCKLCSLWSAIESIRLALAERASTVAYTLPILLQTELTKFSFLSSFNELEKGITELIQMAMSDLIIRFVNHTDSSGDWNGQADIPLWTEADILTAIGASERLSVTRLSSFSAWIKQQYDIINLLKWVWKNLSFQDSKDKSGTFNSESEWNSSAWNDIGVSSNISGTSIPNDPGGSDHTRRIGKPSINTSSSIYKDIDFYLFPVQLSDQYDFNALGNTLTEGVFNYLETISSVNTSVVTTSNYYMPAEDWTALYGNGSFINLQSYGIVKYDVSGGFQFKNW
ncbi:MAG: hypothetical protein WC373_01765 [Smithella sp.]|jgi:hypothetical protein